MQEYLGGLMDAIGELNRYAVLRATARDLAAVQHARETVDQVRRGRRRRRGWGGGKDGGRRVLRGQGVAVTFPMPVRLPS